MSIHSGDSCASQWRFLRRSASGGRRCPPSYLVTQVQAASSVSSACGSFRKDFHIGDRLAIAVYACGADVVVSAGTFIVALGCRNKVKVAEALALITTEEEAR
jgi:hypothetical protein